MGQWAHPGEITEINSNDITMEGVDYPVLGISDTGDTKLMQPGENYKFKGKKVTEFPMMEKGGWLNKYKAQTGISLGVQSGTYQPTSKTVTKKELGKHLENVEAAKMQEKLDNQGYISKAGPAQSAASKAWNIMVHPMTALSYKTHGKDIPEHFERGELNPLDYAVNVINPFGVIDATASIPGNLKRGEFLQAGLNTLGALPMLSEFRGAAKTVAPVLKNASKTANRSVAKSVGKTIDDAANVPKKLSIAEGNILKNELAINNQISRSEIDKAIKKESNWLNSDEYIRRRMANTGESAETIKADIAKYHERIKNTEFIAGETHDPDNTLGEYVRSRRGDNPKIVLSDDLGREHALNTLDHEVKHAMSQSSGLTPNYKNYPTIKVGNWFQRNIAGIGENADHIKYLNLPEEQQVRGLRLLDAIEESEGIPKGTKLTTIDLYSFMKKLKPGTEAGQKFADNKGDVGELVEAIANKYKKDVKYPARKRLVDFLNQIYTVPGAAVVGGAGVLGAGSKEKKNGGWLNKYK
jgi:hypothetical protein